MSSDDIAIRVSNLSKRFEIYDRPRDRLKQFFTPGLRKVFGMSPKKYFREFWALDDVSFDVKKNEAVGVIGRNGSGKSTLLQMICGTLTPTSGIVETKGRIAALLELGSGFNPEFTGRENVFMNAAVLGMSREEISARFDEIADFADIGQFIDQPVKNYSSGMMVRLAFSVAVHVQPEILIVDEALAVGDIVFQIKCLDKMEEMRERGTTIFFVSHSLEQIKRFCTTAIWIDQGKVQLSGEANFVTDRYRDASLRQTAVSDNDQSAKKLQAESGSAPAMLVAVEASAKQLAPFEPLSVTITYKVGDVPLPKLLVGVAIRDAKGAYIFGPNTYLDQVTVPFTPGVHTVEYHIPRLPLLTGTFVLDAGLFSDAGLVCIDYLGAAAEVCVVAEYFSEGLVYIEHEWRTITHA